MSINLSNLLFNLPQNSFGRDPYFPDFIPTPDHYPNPWINTKNDTPPNPFLPNSFIDTQPKTQPRKEYDDLYAKMTPQQKTNYSKF